MADEDPQEAKTPVDPLTRAKYYGAPLTSKERSYRDALEWYKERAESIARYLSQKQTDAVMAVVTELSLDMGARARRALSVSPDETTTERPRLYPCPKHVSDYRWPHAPAGTKTVCPVCFTDTTAQNGKGD